MFFVYYLISLINSLDNKNGVIMNPFDGLDASFDSFLTEILSVMPTVFIGAIIGVVLIGIVLIFKERKKREKHA